MKEVELNHLDIFVDSSADYQFHKSRGPFGVDLSA